MGFSPERFTFILAVIVLGLMSKSIWEAKFDVYKKCGWSEEEILDAFKNHPSIMTASEGRIKTLMDFFVNIMGFKASFIAKQFYFLGLSMEKRLERDGGREGEKMSKVRDGGEKERIEVRGRDGGEEGKG
ncbi:hypothetical protein Goshw_026858 [Gossypium schwendimanii]|uniref:Uncharacterized protein n=1 Tax=Gossypium schwendimanii TaxID=34291 RepID=A0A7J9N1K7_GOSSC|nr:hypothetical protein [Gossypium schwendimanii]